VKFSTNGVKIDPAVARRLAASDYVDVQISLDGATAEVNDAVRGPGSYATALRAMRHLAEAGFRGFKISVVVTRQNVSQLDDFKAIADRFGAQLRLTRLRRRAVAPRCGMSCTRRPASSGSSTTGWWPTASRC
jgi:MoaA/NifB/PqqE/SkfB family radical SAM enzyme